jgi:hypothetical protein
VPRSIASICPDFMRFWESARDQPDDEAARLWDGIYEEPNRDVVDVYYSAWGRKERVRESLPRFAEVGPGIARTEGRLRGALPAAELQTAAQFRVDDLERDYLLMVGVFSSDSWVTEFGGRITSSYALEMLADEDERIVLSHELAHLAHARALHASWRADPESSPILAALYREGVAILASRALAPEATDAEILWLGRQPPERSLETVESRRDELSRELVSALDDPARYGEFFLGAAAVDFPPRAGYYVADVLARAACARTDLATWARYSKADVQDELLSLLRRAT